MHRLGFAYPIVLLASLLALGCERSPNPTSDTGGGGSGKLQKAAAAREVMGTFAEVTAYAEDKDSAEQAVAAGYDALDAVNRLMSDYRDDSEISALNRAAAGAPVAVSLDTWACFGLARLAARLSDGAFDPTVRPLIGAWRVAAQAERLPTAEALQSARQRVGYQHLVLDPVFLPEVTSSAAAAPSLAAARLAAWGRRDDGAQFSAARAIEGLEVDLGGIAKGYALDLAVRAMRDAGAPAGIVNVGGDIVFFGDRPDGEGWRVGVRHPFESGLFGTLVLRDARETRAVATSGLQQRFFEVDGRRFSHIIDPRTGQPVEQAPSVTVIARDGTTADAFATIFSVLTIEQGQALLAGGGEAVAEIEVLWIAGPADDPTVVLTEGFEGYLGGG